MEILDAYKEDGTLAGFDINREEIPEGYYCLTCDVIVKHKDGTYLAMQRDYAKPIYPGYFEITAGGCALKGENKLECVKRELKEETGINCDCFVQVGFQISKERRYICYDFLCEVDCDKDSIILQKGETISYRWLDNNQVKKLMESEFVIPVQRERMKKYFEVLNIGKKYKVIVDRKIGDCHPDYKDLVYEVNYGYIPEIIGGDGEFQDAYILGVDNPIDEFEGILIGIVIRLNDLETKWIIASNNNYSDKEIKRLIYFQEKYFNTVIVR